MTRSVKPGKSIKNQAGRPESGGFLALFLRQGLLICHGSTRGLKLLLYVCNLIGLSGVTPVHFPARSRQEIAPVVRTRVKIEQNNAVICSIFGQTRAGRPDRPSPSWVQNRPGITPGVTRGRESEGRNGTEELSLCELWRGRAAGNLPAR